MPCAQLDYTKPFNYGSKEFNRANCLEKQPVLACDTAQSPLAQAARSINSHLPQKCQADNPLVINYCKEAAHDS